VVWLQKCYPLNERGNKATLALTLLVDKHTGQRIAAPQDGVGTVALMYFTKSLVISGIRLC
jgi:hypothetical protein